MAKMHKFDRRGSGPWFVIVVALLTFFMYSLALAASTADDCGDGVGKHWSYWPPQWECEPVRG
ncbi:MAG TPA: hypothetical protein VFV32_15460 [Acidimicrobiales bacterium]|nr:hypothetical protein [Acidimicrobiales bacterium]